MRGTMVHALEHRTTRTIEKGANAPLGATLTPDGVNFALYSEHAAEVFLLLFDEPNGAPTDSIRLDERDKFIWHALVRGLQAGQLYGYKVRGEYRPEWGLRFNDAKLLLDPYAKAVTGKFRNVDNLLLAYDPRPAAGDLVPDPRDNTAIVPKAIVVDDTFDWQGATSPDLAMEQLVIYEVHVKGFTAHASSGVEFPGTYLGFIEKIPHLTRLGINTVELLPVHEHYVDDFLIEKGLTNYWGYNSIGFFAPEVSYSTRRTPGCQVAEFKTMVRELRKAGLKIILDVVYNHSAEGSEMGPTLSFRGVDNLAYYSLTGPPDAPRRYYQNYSGCGNSLNLESRASIRLVMDSLRYWIDVMHVDGFRFDLASILGRSEGGAFRSSSAFFDAVSQDPVLTRAILIAEPWDLGTYQVGNFPVDWSEWNGRFRDTIRRFGKGDAGQLADLGWRLTGSADLYGEDGRSAYNSVNFVTCHDGFTLCDLVSYNEKHNEANGEQNQDGSSDNHSWNCGVEGDTGDPGVLALRRQLTKNFACMLLFASGTPMILGGDEFARTQRGNNNAYCQDNEISWFDWTLASRHQDLVAFFRKAIAFTRRFPVLQRRKFFLGEDLDDDAVPDLTWFSPDLGYPRWQDAEARTLCYQLDASEDGSDPGVDRLFFILNGHFEPQWAALPPLPSGHAWHRAVDTSLPSGEDFAEPGREVRLDPPDRYVINSRSVVVLLARRP
ncbi:MAG: glycogen debranching protein GlgX [Acidobacteria bacterium]|nr:glycogen debranching protein GlgX [Acidobacteriota bacterium]